MVTLFKVVPTAISFPYDALIIQQGPKSVKIDKHSEVKIGAKSITGEELFNIFQSK